MFVKPLRGLRERSNSMGLALPHANHRDNQKYKGRQFEKVPPSELSVIVLITPNNV